jgi:predicted N-acetyltransferase YhbS
MWLRTQVRSELGRMVRFACRVTAEAVVVAQTEHVLAAVALENGGYQQEASREACRDAGHAMGMVGYSPIVIDVNLVRMGP